MVHIFPAKIGGIGATKTAPSHCEVELCTGLTKGLDGPLEMIDHC